MKPRSRLVPRLLTFLVFLAVIATLLFKYQAIIDWAKLRNYTPPATVAQLAVDDTMTAKAQHLFYVNHPDITTGTVFSKNCPSGGEKTVVLGCYIGNDSGIYLYDVTDQRLQGVEQVTAAHETLHAAYRRLSNAERTKVDAMLTDYYAHDLHDQRVLDTIAAYKKSEPNDVVNEMHSVFGTEVANLPAPLETYYKQYFTDRSRVTNYTASYESEFTNREAQVKADDVQLQMLKQHIDTNEATLATQKTNLDAQSKQLQAKRSNGDISGYNSGVDSYNTAVNSYNALLATTRNLITQYNDLVASRNAIALEEQQLTKALSDTSLQAQ